MKGDPAPPGPRRALVLADGSPPSRAGLDAAWPGWDADIGYVVAADGGARLAAGLGLRLDRWVGDGDSLSVTELDALRETGIPVELVRQDKDESDTELAVLAAVGIAQDVTVLGALGGARFDHTVANVSLLEHPALVDRTVRLLDDRSRVTLLRADDAPGSSVHAARQDLPGRAGDLVSLFPIGEAVHGVTTEGLRYVLRDDTLLAGPARGLSNVRTDSHAAVSIRTGRLLIVETPATLNR